MLFHQMSDTIVINLYLKIIGIVFMLMVLLDAITTQIHQDIAYLTTGVRFSFSTIGAYRELRLTVLTLPSIYFAITH